jgi:hypothetical protein
MAPSLLAVNRWTQLSQNTLTPGRQSHTSVINPHTGLVYVIGGGAIYRSPIPPTYYSDVWVFNTITSKL